jgi:anti-sigma-K factor RskA
LNKSEVIASGLLEHYVLGLTTAEETAMIHNLCRQHPELAAEIEAIEESLMDFSGKTAKPLPKELKDRIAGQLHFAGEKNVGPARIVPLQSENSSRLKLYKFGMAASLLLFVTSLAYNVLLNRQLSRVNGELAELSAAKTYMAEEMKVQQTSLKNLSTELQVVADPNVKTIALKGMNTMEKHSAMIHWNRQTDEVYFNAAALPESPAAKQYQLWAIVDGKPVDAGMIDLNRTASVFQKMRSIKGAQAFAVTIENMGGSPVPTMETMCLLGNV